MHRTVPTHRLPSVTRVSRAACAVIGAGVLGTSGAVLAQSGPGAELDEVVISTGTRGKQIAVTNSASPIDVVSGEAIRATGKASLREVLGTLVPSYTAPSQPGGGTSA
jgi:iron complex outermembrane receptor protein